MTLYAVTMNTARPDLPDDWWLEFYSAADSDEAEMKAEDEFPGCAVVCTRAVPTRGIFRAPYWGYTLFPQRTPNGVWWMLYGRVLVMRHRRHLHFSVRLRKHDPGWSFGIGPR